MPYQFKLDPVVLPPESEDLRYEVREFLDQHLTAASPVERCSKMVWASAVHFMYQIGEEHGVDTFETDASRVLSLPYKELVDFNNSVIEDRAERYRKAVAEKEVNI